LTQFTWPKINEASPLGFLLLTSFLFRLALIPFFLDDFNAWAYGAFGSILIGGHDPYLVVSRDPTLLNINPWRYPPFYLLFTVPALLAKIATGQTLVYLAILKIPLAICDVVSTLFLYRILAMHFGGSNALKGAAIFTFNPAVVFVTAVAGFSDPLAVMFTLIALYYFLSYKESADPSATTGLFKSALLLGLGIVAKIYPLFLVPIFVRDAKAWRDRILYLTMTAFPALAFSLPFLISDPYSYLYMLTLKNAGGEHPLFGALSLPVAAELFLLGIMALLLVWVYSISVPIYTRLVLTFLWINLVTLSAAFQYLTWGIPFFILLLYQNKSTPKVLPLYPMIAVLSALVFNGFYNVFAGSTGPYYWMFHVLNQQVVVFRAYPLVGEIAAPLSAISILVTIYYILRIGPVQRLQKIHVRLPNVRILGRIRCPTITNTRHILLSLLLIVIVAISWSYVATHSTFEAFSYPTIQRSVFDASFQFQSSTLDYQLVFAGNASYSITASSETVTLSSTPTNSSAMIYRGWLHIRDGFRPSNSALVSFNFKLDNFPSAASWMNIATLSGGHLFVARNNTGSSFDYFDSAVNANRTISVGDMQWHNLTVNYTQQNTAVALDNHILVLAPTTLTRVILGNENDSLPFGSIEYSDFQASVRDFPGGVSLPFFAVVALAAPLTATIVAFAFIPGGFLRPRRGSQEAAGAFDPVK